jgi:hypothetical protein
MGEKLGRGEILFRPMSRRSQTETQISNFNASMKNKYAKQPSAMEVENLIYEVALNRALILILLEELEKTNPGLTERIQDVLNAESQRIYGLVSQFVEEPSPYYAPLLEMRKTHDDADKAAAILKSLLTDPEPPKPKGKKKR